MPVVFAQPAPAGAFNMIAQQGNMPAYLSAYASLANTAQEGYDRQAATQSQERLGYAQMMQDAALRRQALGVQEAEIAIRPQIEMQAAQMHADLQLRNWAVQQRFTQQDQMELARQENAAGQIVQLLQNGDITPEEAQRAASQRAWRVDFLKKKQEYTASQALEEQRKSMAMKNQADKERIESLNAFSHGEIDSLVEDYIPTEDKAYAAQYMRDYHPELQPGSPEYDAKMKLEMSQQGVSKKVVRIGGKLVSYDELMNGKKAAGTAGGDRAVTEQQDTQNHERAMQAADKARRDMAATDPTASKEKLDAEWERVKKLRLEEYGKVSEAHRAASPEGKKAAAKEANNKQIAAFRTKAEKPEPGLSPPDQQSLTSLRLHLAKKLEAYPPGRRPPKAAADIERLAAKINEYLDKAKVGLLPQTKLPLSQIAQPAAAPVQQTGAQRPFQKMDIRDLPGI